MPGFMENRIRILSQNYVKEIIRMHLGYSPRHRDVEAAIKNCLDDLSWDDEGIGFAKKDD